MQVTGGRNGYGAKLANIFSTEFIVETCDGCRQKRYRQRFHANMSAKDDPKVCSMLCQNVHPLMRISSGGCLAPASCTDLLSVLHITSEAFLNTQVSTCKASDNWTSITFSPDLAKFGMTHLEAQTVALMRKRTYDLAGVLGKTVKVLPRRVAYCTCTCLA